MANGRIFFVFNGFCSNPLPFNKLATDLSEFFYSFNISNIKILLKNIYTYHHGSYGPPSITEVTLLCILLILWPKNDKIILYVEYKIVKKILFEIIKSVSVIKFLYYILYYKNKNG